MELARVTRALRAGSFKRLLGRGQPCSQSQCDGGSRVS